MTITFINHRVPNKTAEKQIPVSFFIDWLPSGTWKAAIWTKYFVECGVTGDVSSQDQNYNQDKKILAHLSVSEFFSHLISVSVQASKIQNQSGSVSVYNSSGVISVDLALISCGYDNLLTAVIAGMWNNRNARRLGALYLAWLSIRVRRVAVSKNLLQ